MIKLIKNFELIREKDKRELESLLMVLNGVIRELEYTLESNMNKETKFSKSLVFLDEIEDYSDKTRKLMIKVIGENREEIPERRNIYKKTFDKIKR